MRPTSINGLLVSLQSQTLQPDVIIIIDGSTNKDTYELLNHRLDTRLTYFLVPPELRGLTKQRNFGISKVAKDIDVVCFLDDDVLLESDYFEQLIKTYSIYPEALGVGGYIQNEVVWSKANKSVTAITQFQFDGWVRNESVRFVLRKKLALDSDCPPGYMPQFGHGRSLSFIPPSGKIYRVEQLMGGVSSFRRSIFEEVKFSEYFEGYGLYEDADFTIRVSKIGPLFINTNAKINHYHEPLGRPNHFQFGKMVVRNGWYVWRVKNPNPNIIEKIKWHSITHILLLIRFSNCFFTSAHLDAFSESLGRKWGWLTLFWNKPNIRN